MSWDPLHLLWRKNRPFGKPSEQPIPWSFSSPPDPESILLPGRGPPQPLWATSPAKWPLALRAHRPVPLLLRDPFQRECLLVVVLFLSSSLIQLCSVAVSKRADASRSRAVRRLQLAQGGRASHPPNVRDRRGAPCESPTSNSWLCSSCLAPCLDHSTPCLVPWAARARGVARTVGM